MTNSTISGLTAASTPLAGTELVPIAQSGTKKATIANIVGAGTSPGKFTDVTADNTNSTVGQTANCYLNTSNSNFGDTHTATFQTVLNNTTTGANDLQLLQFNHNTGSQVEVVLKANSGNSGYVALYTANTEKIRLDSTGNVSFAVAAKGINFTANTPAAGMTSRLLNWYEEGTWTPVLVPTTGTITSQVTSGTYVRVGKMITCQFKAAITGGTVTAISQITGLPFTSLNVAATSCGVCREYNATGNTWVLLAGSNATNLVLIRYDNSNGCNNTYAWAGSVTYQTN